MQLRERITADGARVDREAGVIHGVKLLGSLSTNRRKYSAKAIEQAAKMYEGAAVNVDHPSKPGTGERSVTDGIGWIQSVEVKDGVPYGDLHVLKSHPSAAMVLEAAERNPKRFGMSHNADGVVEVQEGRNVVTSINRVISVDIVQNPATTQGFFESEQDCTVGELLEASGDWALLLEDAGIAPYAAQPAMRPPMMGGMQQPGMQSGQPPIDPQKQQQDAQVSAAFKSIAMAIFDSPDDVRTKLGKLATILDTQAEIMGTGAPEMPEEMGVEDEFESSEPSEDEPQMPPMGKGKPMANDQKKKPFGESELLTKLGNLLEKAEAREAKVEAVELLESKGREPSPERVAAVLKAEADKRESLIESYPPRQTQRGERPQRSVPAKTMDKYPATSAEFAAALRN
jgi:hypothetical protein